MKLRAQTRASAAFAVLLLAVCATQAAPAAPPVLPPAAALLRSGLDVAGFDRTVRPADDFYRFVAGGWIEHAEIPADRPSWGSFDQLSALSETRVHALLEDLAASPAPAGTNARRLGDFYRSFMDTERRNRLGATPLSAERTRIAALRTADDLAAWLGRAQGLGFSSRFDDTRILLDAPLAYAVDPDLRDSRRYAPYLAQAGITLPDRDYYLRSDARYREFRRALTTYVAEMFRLAGEPHARAKAIAVVALETRLARAQWTREQSRDPLKIYNRMSVADLESAAPGFPWRRFLAAAGSPQDGLIVEQPGFCREFARLSRTTPLADWKAYLTFKLLDGYGSALSKRFQDLEFGFHERTLHGVADPPPRWRPAVGTLDLVLGEAVGQEYVARHFRPEAKAHARALIDNLLRAFAESLDGLEWMSPETREAARQKLARISVKVGYPDRWRDWSSLEVSPTDLVGNLMRVAAVNHAWDQARLTAPVDRTEWLVSPQTVEAYYYPPLNEMVFAAAILQPPFFDPDAEDAVNYGAIGGFIGHEISHAFDDTGRKYDGDGNLHDWWTPEDAARFEQRAAALVAEFSGFVVLDGQHVNGRLTLGENIGDLSGLAVAYRAWRLSLAGREPPVLDGFTGAQRFFLGWGQAWRVRIRDDALRERLLTNRHSPAQFRVNGVVSNLDAFYEAFGVAPGDKMYRAPDDRVKIW